MAAIAHKSLKPLVLSADDSSSTQYSSAKNSKKPSKVLKLIHMLCFCFRSKSQTCQEDITLLPREGSEGKKTLVLDLDETLVHSSMEPVDGFDFKLNIQINDEKADIYVSLRPWVNEFLDKVSEMYEVIIFTASLKIYADPVIDRLDKNKVIKNRLFRTECMLYNGNYVKNLSLLGRDLKKVIIIDNSPSSYSLHPLNAIGITSWFNDKADTQLQEVFRILEVLHKVDDIPGLIRHLGTENLELSPTNINLVMDSYLLGRSALNSPKPANVRPFEFLEKE